MTMTAVKSTSHLYSGSRYGDTFLSTVYFMDLPYHLQHLSLPPPSLLSLPPPSPRSLPPPSPRSLPSPFLLSLPPLYLLVSSQTHGVRARKLMFKDLVSSLAFRHCNGTIPAHHMRTKGSVEMVRRGT